MYWIIFAFKLTQKVKIKHSPLFLEEAYVQFQMYSTHGSECMQVWYQCYVKRMPCLIIYRATSQWIMRSDTHLSFWHMWRNPCIWSSKLCQLHVDFSFRCGVDLVYFVLAYKKSKLGEVLLFQINPFQTTFLHHGGYSATNTITRVLFLNHT